MDFYHLLIALIFTNFTYRIRPQYPTYLPLKLFVFLLDTLLKHAIINGFRSSIKSTTTLLSYEGSACLHVYLITNEEEMFVFCICGSKEVDVTSFFYL